MKGRGKKFHHPHAYPPPSKGEGEVREIYLQLCYDNFESESI